MENVSCYSGAEEEGLFTNTGFISLWLSAVPLVTMCFISVTANGAIIVMFISKARLRKCRNTYILNLAIADLFIGFTLPLSIFETLGEEWMLSNEACTFFLTVRYSLYYVTILSIILITVDRWWSVNFPFSYRIRRSKKMAFIFAAFVWVLSFAIHIPTIGAWNILHLPTAKKHKYCRVPYEYNSGFTISASIIEFFIPLLILLSLNAGLYIKLARRRNNKTLRRSLSTSDGKSVYRRKSSSDSDNTNNSEDLNDLLMSLPARLPSSFVTQFRRSSGGHQQIITKLYNSSRRGTGRFLSAEYSSLLAVLPRRVSNNNQRKASRASISSRGKSNDDVVRDFLIRQDNKALLSLGLLVLMFVICWTPTTLCDILYSLCPGKIPLWMIQLSYWILALNSAVNPFLYGIGNSDFRRVAKSWLFCSQQSQCRLLETILFNQLAQPTDLMALKEVEQPVNRDV